MKYALLSMAARLVVLAASFAFASWILSDDLEISGGVSGYLLAAVVFSVVNAVIGPVLRLLAIPLTAVTLGLFALVINGVLLMIAAWLSDAIEVSGFGSAVLAALILAMVSAVLGALTLYRG